MDPRHRRAFERRGAKVFGKHARGSTGAVRAKAAAADTPSSAKRSRSNSELERSGVVRAFLLEKCELPSSACEEYAEALVAQGFDDVKSIALMAEGDWPKIVKPGHRQKVTRVASAQLARPLCRCL